VRQAPPVSTDVPDALVETPDLGQANATRLFRPRNAPPGSATDANDARVNGGAGVRERFGLARILQRSAPRDRIAQLLDAAGVRLDGDSPWDMTVNDQRVHARIIAHGSLGLGEAYMDGWWDAQDLDGFLLRVLRARLDERVGGIDDAALFVRSKLINLQHGWRARVVGERHYDLGNDLFRAMLGQRLVYSCGYWNAAHDLDTAQEAKLDLVCRKLGLARGMRVLDIGCGWGEALHYAATHYGVSGVGITISKEQAQFARDLCAGLPIEIRLQDYRELDEQFDRSWSIGMFEHVGVKNYRSYFEVARRCLVADGLTLLHTIGGNQSTNHTDPWIGKYIFPNSMIPSAMQVGAAHEGLFVMEDWHNFGADYDRTLMAWRANFERAWPALREKYGERFQRMWRFYLSASAASFRCRRNQLWQIVLSPEGVAGGYRAPR
jgi:cyclopropane-fatty-acyl-phospholipid synthase